MMQESIILAAVVTWVIWFIWTALNEGEPK
jgi:hypothetical protein